MGFPKYFFKFRSLNTKQPRERDNSFRMLTAKEIFFASPKAFNDPFDSGVRIRYEKCTREEFFNHFTKYLKESKIAMEENEREKRIGQAYNAFLTQQPEDLAEYSNQISDELKGKVGVFSLCADYKNILLWSHYADKHQGFCVGFASRRLFDFCLSYSGLGTNIISLEKISYRNRYPIINAYLTSEAGRLRCLTTKAINWKYEMEYRLIWAGGANKDLSLGDGIIKRVILGCKISTPDRDKIRSILRSHNMNIALIQAKEKKDSFGLDFEQLKY